MRTRPCDSTVYSGTITPLSQRPYLASFSREMVRSDGLGPPEATVSGIYRPRGSQTLEKEVAKASCADHTGCCDYLGNAEHCSSHFLFQIGHFTANGREFYQFRTDHLETFAMVRKDWSLCIRRGSLEPSDSYIRGSKSLTHLVKVICEGLVGCLLLIHE